MLKIAYLINQYPKVSHSFIRTEILALEQHGIAVERIAMRGWDMAVADQLDEAEGKRTRYVLQGGALPLIGATLAAALSRPARFLSALRTAWGLSRGGERGFAYHLIYLAEACLTLRWLVAANIPHVHAHFGSNAAAVALLIRTLGGPSYSITIHGSEEFDKPLQWKLREKIAGAAFVAGVSSFCRSQLFRWSNLADWPKLRIVHCAIDPRFEHDTSNPAPANDTIVCVGRLCEQKGHLLLIRVVAALSARGTKVRLILAGDGEMRPEVEHEITVAGLQDEVSITGWVSGDGVREALEKSRALVLPSFAEGLPVVIMEAMASRRPVVSTYIGGIPELVRTGVDGILVPAGDAEALTDALERLFAMDAAELARIGEGARQRVLERHSSMTEAGKLATLFRETVAGGGVIKPAG